MKRLLVVCALLMIALPALGQIGPTIKVRKTTTDTLNYGIGLPVGAIKDSVAAHRTELNKIAPVFNVKSYGAVGDGVTDDAPAIVATVAAARAVGMVAYLPDGRYAVPSSLFLPDSNTVLVGVRPAEYDLATGTFSEGAIIVGSVTTHGHNARFKNLTIYNPNGTDVFQSSGNNSVFENCRFVGRYAQDAAHAFLSSGATGVDVINCKAFKTVHGFAIRSSNVRMINCVADSNGFNGLIIKAGDGEHNRNIQVEGFASYHQPSSSVGVRIQIDNNANSQLTNVSLSSVVVDSNASGVGLYIENDYGNYAHMRGVSVSGGAMRGAGVQMYRASNVLVSGMSIWKSGFGLDTCRNIIFSACMVDSSPSYSYNAYNGSDSIFALACKSTYPAGVLDAVGLTYYSINGISSLAYNTLTSIPDTGVNGAGMTGNLRMVSIAKRRKGLGPVIGFVVATDTGSTVTNYTQAEIVGAPDNTEQNQARGQIRINVKDFYDDGSGFGFNWRRGALVVHSGADVDIGRDGFYQNYQESKLRVWGAIENRYLTKWYRSGDTVTSVAIMDTSGNLGVGGLTPDSAVTTSSLHVTQGARIDGNGYVSGDWYTGNGVALRWDWGTFAASTRVAIYLPGTLSTDKFNVNWQLTTDTGTLNGGNIWCFTKTDSLIVWCSSTSSEQFTYVGPRLMVAP